MIHGPANASENDSSKDVPFDVNVEDRFNNPSTLGSSPSTEVSAPYVGRWNILISQTNWEKGAIIVAWRNALIDSGASPSEFSDEAWSKTVDGVTPQHVGRLRRVYDRFSTTHESYPKLYWTHFLAALDWDDAELWLEGASQSKWSVAQMRKMRWEVTGSDPNQVPQDSDIVASETDDGFDALAERDERVESEEENRDRIGSSGPLPEGPDFGDEDVEGYVSTAEANSEAGIQQIQDSFDSPFANLPQIPVDVADAMEQFKLSIVRHRSFQWQDCPRQNMIQVLDALKAFALQGE